MFPKGGKQIIFKFINKAVWDLYPIYKKTFHFEKHLTIKEYNDISITHTGGQRFTRFGSSLYTNTYIRSKPVLSVG